MANTSRLVELSMVPPLASELAKQIDTAKPTSTVERAVTATANGLTTGLLLPTDGMVLVTSADANNIVTLPPLSASLIGLTIYGAVLATGCEIRPTGTNTINGVAGPNEAALAANSSFQAIAVTATGWRLNTWANPVPDA